MCALRPAARPPFPPHHAARTVGLFAPTLGPLHAENVNHRVANIREEMRALSQEEKVRPPMPQAALEEEEVMGPDGRKWLLPKSWLRAAAKKREKRTESTKVDPESLRFETRRTVAIDGFVMRRTRYGAWKERYLRTEGPYLLYYSSGLKEIKSNRFEGTKLGPYRYDSVGKSWSETLDLRAIGTTISRAGSECVFVVSRGAKKLELKAESSADAARWVETLQRIRAWNEWRKKRIGTLRLEIDGLYLFGAKGRSLDFCECVATVTGESQTGARARIFDESDVSYEALDGEHLQSVSTARDAQLQAEFPVYQASTLVELSIMGYTTIHQRPASIIDTFRGSLSGSEDTALPRQTGSNGDIVLASRTLSLFELQEEIAAEALAVRWLRGAHEGEIGEDVDWRWPLYAPDGRCAKPGYRWLPLFEDDERDEESTSERRPLSIRALAQARVVYSESVLNTIDVLDAHERYEANDDQDLTEFKLDLLSSAVHRLEAVYDEFYAASAAIQSCLDWDEPMLSLLVWLLVVSAVLFLPDSGAGLAVFPMFAIIGIMGTLPRALFRARRFQVEGEATYALAQDEKVPRQIAQVSLAIVSARNLLAADKNSFYVKSDPYAAIILEPPAASSAKRISQMLIGVTSVKSSTLNPDWAVSTAAKSHNTVPTKSCMAQSPSRTSDEAAKPIANDVRGDGEEMGDARRRRRRHLPSMASLKTAGPIESAEEALKLVVGAGLGDHILNDLLEESGGRNAASLSSGAIKNFGDGAVVKPPVDFRSCWRIEGDLIGSGSASWTWPLMQEMEADASPVPWHRAKGSILVEIYDHDVASSDDFLGCCRIPIARLFPLTGAPCVLDEWFDLKRYTNAAEGDEDDNVANANVSSKKNSVIDESAAPNLGRVRIAARARILESADSASQTQAEFDDGDTGTVAGRHTPWYSISARNPRRSLRAARWSTSKKDGHGWRHDQAIRRSLLEPHVHIENEKKVGYVGQYKDVTRSLKSMQNSVLSFATFLERFVALCTWVHPTKTVFVTACLLVAMYVLLIVPSRLCVAAVVTKLFLNGLVLKIRGHDNSEVPFRDPTEIQVTNLINSLPNATQRAEAYRIRRALWAAQYRKRENAVRTSLHFSFRVRCQIHACVLSGRRHAVFADAAADSPQTSDKRWTYVYVVVVDGLILVWPTLVAAADNKRPLVSLHISGPALVNHDVEPPPDSWPSIPAALHLVSVACCLSRSSKIKDFYLAIGRRNLQGFVSAVRHEILDSLNYEDHKPTSHHKPRRSSIFDAWPSR